MPVVDDNELVSIKSLLVEPDRKNPTKYWIWMKILSKVRTVVRLNACIVDGIVAYPDNSGEIGLDGRRCLFMGRHNLQIGENELPALPLAFHKEIGRRNVVVRFGVKSRRNPKIFHRKFQIVGPGLFVAQQS